MSTYRLRLQEALLRKWKIENGKCKFSTLHFTFSILTVVAYTSFAAAWLVAIVTHL